VPHASIDFDVRGKVEAGRAYNLHGHVEIGGEFSWTFHDGQQHVD
jgi:hypothetical protein